MIRPLLAALLLAACKPDPTVQDTAVVPLGDPVDLVAKVDPFIGSGGLGYQVGSGMPGATLPFGHMRLSPDTGLSDGSAPGFHRGGGYHAEDTRLLAVSHTHLHGVGLTDYGAVGIAPADGLLDDDGDGQHLREHRPNTMTRQEAGPGWFELSLDQPEVDIALNATRRAGRHVYSFADTVEEPVLFVDLTHTLGKAEVPEAGLTWAEDGGSLSGWRTSNGEMTDGYRVYVDVRFEPAPVAWGTWEGSGEDEATGPVSDATSIEVPGGAWARFDEREITVRVGVSLVDAEGAAANLDAELAELDAGRETGLAAWTEAFERVRVWGGTEAEQVIFASSLYKSAIMPSQLDDADGRYLGYDGVAHDAGSRRYLSDMSLWDTYRTTHPLYTMVWPAWHRDMLWSMGRMAEEGGNLPRWPMATEDGGFMVGTPAHIVAAEAWWKGLRDWDEDIVLEKALAVALGEETPSYGGRPDPTLVDAYGYYPSDEVGRSVAWLQEAAIADHALAVMAADLGEADAAAHLAERAGSWRNVWDEEVGFFHARMADGSFEELESESAWGDEYAEGNARQYLWLVPHDPEGLIETMGGEAAFLGRLDEFFEETVDAEDDWAPGTPEAWYWHGNEPDIHAPFLFALAGDQAGAVEWSHWVMQTRYSTEPDGLWGNDDGGTLSAWYVFAAMGLYPLAGTDRYVLGDPVFRQVELDLDGGTLTIERLGEGELAEVRLDGERIDDGDVVHSELLGGRTLSFVGADAL